MEDEPATDRRKSLKLTYDELCTRIDRQREELRSQRETAVRTLRVTVVLIGVLITFSYQFRQAINTLLSQPFQPTISNVLGGLLIPTAGTFLILSPIFSVMALREGHFSESIEPNDLRALSVGTLQVKTENDVLTPSHYPEDWYQYIIHQYTDTIADNDDVLRESSRLLRLSHSFLALAPVVFALGIWLSEAIR